MSDKTRVIAAAAVFAAASISAVPSLAREAGPAGFEIRGALPGTYEVWENHVWRFQAGGRITGSLSAQQIGIAQPGYIKSDDVGRWRKVGRQVCVTWRQWYRGRELCYRMVMLGSGKTLFENTNGTVSFQGTYRRQGI